MSGENIWFVGCGNMGGAMLRRWLDTGTEPSQITVIDPQTPELPQGVHVLAAPAATLPSPDLLILAIKPALLDAVAYDIAPLLGVNTLLVSTLAGVRLANLRERFLVPHTIVRAMPNLPVALGKGVVALLGEDREASEAAGLTTRMRKLGLVEWIEDEAQFDAVTALSGSGPAFVYRFIDAMAAGGVALGLPPDQSLRMALAMTEGAAASAAAADVSPADLARRVASPGGTTERGLDVLDEGRTLNALVMATLRAAAERAREMAAAASGRNEAG